MSDPLPSVLDVSNYAIGPDGAGVTIYWDFMSLASIVIDIEYTVQYLYFNGSSDDIGYYHVWFSTFDGQTYTDYSVVENFILTDGNDRVNAAVHGALTVYGMGGDDILTASIFLDGGDGNDSLTGAGTMIGGNGDDVFHLNAGGAQMIGGDGIDTVDYSRYASGITVDLAAGTGTGSQLSSIENVLGTGFADVLTGSSAANALTGAAGDDVLSGGAGADHLDGGDGTDTADYDPDPGHNTVGVTVDLAAGTASGGNAQGDVLVGIENLAGTAYADTLTGDAGANSLWGRDGNDVLNGGLGNDVLYGDAGADSLLGGDGDDTLAGGAGGDVMDGGSGTDVANYAAALAGVTLNLATGLGTGGDALGDSYTSIENVLGSAFADAITGDNGANRLDGDAGNDVLQGGGGADTLIGGAGFDIADYGASASAVTIDMGTSANSGGDALGDILIGIEAVGGSNLADVLTGDTGANTIWGRAGNDLLSGAAGNDTLYGESGVDTLAGGDGDDVLVGGAGADVLNGGSGSDTVHYAASAAAVRVNLLTGSGAGGDAAGDSYSGVENVVGSAFADQIIGDGGANRLAGAAGADQLYTSGGNDVVDGGDGNDLIVGGGGADVLKGGTGADSFTYGAVTDSTVAAAGRDAIVDFSHAEGDRIDLSLIDADGNAANGNTAFSFLGGGAFTGAGHELRMAVIGGVQVVQADLTGDKVPDMQINVTSATALVAGDFVL